MHLLARESSLAIISDALRDTRAGDGRVVLISGEAGIGKTSLVEHFAELCRERVVWGRCDPLLTPSPLAPFRDIAAQIGGTLADTLLAGAAPSELLPVVLEALQRASPLVVVIEDVHWADEASLDALKYLGRRVQGAQALLLLTMRDDERDARHPLRGVLASLATSRATRRVPLVPLSVSAVGTLVQGSGYGAEAVHRQTGGNPFFITELVAAGDLDCVPVGVRDIV